MITTYKNMFDYQTYYTNTVDNLRYYCIDENLNLPSVTTILRSTKNYTNNYKLTSAMEVGDYMHQYLQNHIMNSNRNDQFVKSNNYLLAESLAKIVILELINEFTEIWGSEVSVYFKDEYAGTIDLIGIHENEVTIVDYKSSYKHKDEKGLYDYYLQCAAYAIAHDWLFKTNIEAIKIFQITRSGEFCINVARGEDFSNYKLNWFDRLKQFNNRV